MVGGFFHLKAQVKSSPTTLLIEHIDIAIAKIATSLFEDYMHTQVMPEPRRKLAASSSLFVERPLVNHLISYDTPQTKESVSNDMALPSPFKIDYIKKSRAFTDGDFNRMYDEISDFLPENSKFLDHYLAIEINLRWQIAFINYWLSPENTEKMDAKIQLQVKEYEKTIESYSLSAKHVRFSLNHFLSRLQLDLSKSVDLDKGKRCG